MFVSSSFSNQFPHTANSNEERRNSKDDQEIFEILHANMQVH